MKFVLCRVRVPFGRYPKGFRLVAGEGWARRMQTRRYLKIVGPDPVRPVK